MPSPPPRPLEACFLEGISSAIIYFTAASASGAAEHVAALGVVFLG